MRDRPFKTTEAARARSRRYYQKHKAKHRARVESWATRNPRAVKEKAKRYRERWAGRQQTRFRRWWLRRFGLTLAEWQQLFDSQGGRCALCHKRFADKANRRLHIDHDHKTGKLRALLCSACNCGLGMFRDNPALLRRAAGYLEAHRE